VRALANQLLLVLWADFNSIEGPKERLIYLLSLLKPLLITVRAPSLAGTKYAIHREYPTPG
jgi:hypothetical protein